MLTNQWHGSSTILRPTRLSLPLPEPRLTAISKKRFTEGLRALVIVCRKAVSIQDAEFWPRGCSPMRDDLPKMASSRSLILHGVLFE